VIKEGIDKVLSLAGIQSFDMGSNTYIKGEQNVTRLKRPEERSPVPLEFITLTGLFDYIVANPDTLDPRTLVLHVEDYNRVELLGHLQPSNDNSRFYYATAICKRPAFRFGSWMSIEDFIIALQSDFARDDASVDDVDKIVGLLGKVASEHVQTREDDGFSQTVQVRSGLTTKTNVKVENPVRVFPWRTFPEISQPETLAVLRFRKQGDGAPMVALFESGGESWRFEAIHAVKDWLTTAFPELNVFA
jgi:hypothetical protein